MNDEQQQVLLEILKSRFPDSSTTSLRKMLQSGRVRVNGEVERDAKRVVEAGEVVDIAQKFVQQTLPPELALLHEDEAIVVVRNIYLSSQPCCADVGAHDGHRRGIGVRSCLDCRHSRRKPSCAITLVIIWRISMRRSKFISAGLNLLSEIAVRTGRPDEAEALGQEAMTIAKAAGDEWNTGWALGIRAAVAGVRGDIGLAADLARANPHYRTIAANDRYSMLEVRLETGRKNQIRAHLSEEQHPIVGDRLYGSTSNPLGRLGLHAKFLGFDHPITGERMSFTAPVPKAFRDLFRLT